MPTMHEALTNTFTFPSIKHGHRETPLNLLPILYKGAAKHNVREVLEEIQKGTFGKIRAERLSLVKLIHETLNANVISGRSLYSVKGTILHIRNFVSWCDSLNMTLSLESLEQCFLKWATLQRNIILSSPHRKPNIGGIASSLCSIFDSVLGLNSGLSYKIGIQRPRHERKPSGSKNDDKRNFEDTYRFGAFLCDITEGLSEQAIWGNLPVIIQLADGNQLIEWSRLRPAENVKRLNDPTQPLHRKRATEAARAAYIADKSFRTRHALINLRIEAELFIFAAQTGMNVAQMYNLERTKYKFISLIDGYELQGYKERSQSLFTATVYSEYKTHFSNYLTWRDAIFSDRPSRFLFPFLNVRGRADHMVPSFAALRKRCSQLDLKFIPPRELRNARSNFLLRETQNPDLTAKLSQHSVATFYKNYHRPNHQIAQIEISRFHAAHDHILAATGPGGCVAARPVPEDISAPHIPEADCLTPSGCLFCEQHRDLDTEDHIWSLVTFKYLKSIELSKANIQKNTPPNPALLTIKRINQKLVHIQSLSTQAQKWNETACCKISDGDYHPKWSGFIRLQEMTAV